MGKTLTEQLAQLLNENSRENRSDTPDFILAEYMVACLEAYERAINDRARWLGPGPT